MTSQGQITRKAAYGQNNEANTQIDDISDQGTCLRSRWSSNKTVSRKYGAESLKVNRPLLCLLAPSCRSTNYSQCSDRLPHFLPYLHPYSSVLSVFSPLLHLSAPWFIIYPIKVVERSRSPRWRVMCAAEGWLHSSMALSLPDWGVSLPDPSILHAYCLKCTCH